MNIDLEQALTSLPSCTRCRQRRIKCDDRLPSCRNCMQVGKECQFRDHVVGEDIPRQYVLSLVQHLQALDPATPRGQVNGDSGLHEDQDEDQDQSLRSSNKQGDAEIHEDSHPPEVQDKDGTKMFDIFAAVPSTSHLNDSIVSYYGPSSAYAAAYLGSDGSDLEVTAPTNQLAPEPYRRFLDAFAINSRPRSEATDAGLPGAVYTKALVAHYRKSIEVFFPVLGDEWFSHVNSLDLDDPDTFNNNNTLLALVQLVTALSLQLMSRSEPSLTTMASMYFFRISERTVHRALRSPNLQLLQLFTLMCIYLLLDRKAGDIWTALHHALSIYDALHLTAGEDEQSKLIRNTLFVLEVYAESQPILGYQG
ncbi:hypothetical protein A1O1_03402 [Capronia coronata CBS 617.96]|uniref:Zn(2)-C6 fungal-type domain-containing protein n=1 Tax=Capronia coronata CBS 617.96 TaxID=1182541 RepID=W9YCR1_9EURO|nr:uncharacterized protein A1O1_03402 [Capronia coronata CBS 617.96]EXJ90303.1 hypothetical protein A1O1_03402 [Capronia coronata CBS 617.96]